MSPYNQMEMMKDLPLVGNKKWTILLRLNLTNLDCSNLVYNHKNVLVIYSTRIMGKNLMLSKAIVVIKIYLMLSTQAKV
jgi:hypothetical protein